MTRRSSNRGDLEAMWDGNVTHTAVSLAASAGDTDTYTAAANVYAIWVSGDGGTGGVWISNSATDNTGLLFMADAADQRVGPFHVAPGTVITFINESTTAATINVISFLNQT